MVGTRVLSLGCGMWDVECVENSVKMVEETNKISIVVAILISLSDYTDWDYFDAYKLEMVLKLNFK